MFFSKGKQCWGKNLIYKFTWCVESLVKVQEVFKLKKKSHLRTHGKKPCHSTPLCTWRMHAKTQKWCSLCNSNFAVTCFLLDFSFKCNWLVVNLLPSSSMKDVQLLVRGRTELAIYKKHPPQHKFQLISLLLSFDLIMSVTTIWRAWGSSRYLSNFGKIFYTTVVHPSFNTVFPIGIRVWICIKNLTYLPLCQYCNS